MERFVGEQCLSFSAVAFAGELFAECPLPHDGTPLTTVRRYLISSSSSSNKRSASGIQLQE
jgi:hypothetical protein